MSEIAFPTRFEELANSSVIGFTITSPELIVGMDGEEITQYMQDLIEGGMDVSKEEVAEKVVDFVYCIIDMLPSLSQENQSMFVQYLLDISKTSVELLPTTTSTSVKNTYKKVLYLFQHFCIKAENAFKNGNCGSTESSAPVAGKGKKKTVKSDNFSWLDFRNYALEVLDLLVSSPLSASWPMGLVQENFLSGVWNYTLKLLIDRPAGVSGTAHKEVATRSLCVKIFARTVGHFGNAKSSSSYATVSTALLEAVVQFEHMAVSVGAELCAQCRSLALSQGSQIIAEILSEISRMNYASMPATSVKNIASFIESFAKAAPASVAEAFPILMKQLDSPAHQIRSAIIQACGYIVTHIHEAIVAQAKALPSSAQNTTHAGDAEDSTAPQPQQDAEGSDEGRNTTGMVRSRDNILDILVERVHDVNPYTRATVLKVWSRLLESGSLPVKRVGGVAAIAVDRLFDKNAAVRRNAVVLMTTVIENNPFSGTLDASLFKLQQVELLKVVAARLADLRVAYREALGLPAEGSTKAGKGGKKDRKSGELAAISEDAEDAEDEEGSEEGGESGDVAAAGAEESGEQESLEEDFLASAEVVEDGQLAENRAKLEYINSVLSMIASIESAVPKIAAMLQSKTTGDVVEALRFFTRAINFKIAGALALFKSAFSLVWHQDGAIKTEMLQAFSAVYLTDGASEHAEALAASEVASNLMHLVRHCDAAEMTSMEKIVGEMYHTKQVEEDAVEAIWEKIERFALTLRKDSTASSGPAVVTPLRTTTGFTELGACLRIVSMIAHSVPSILTEERVALVIEAGLAPEVLQKGDFSALKAALLCLQASPAFLKNCATVGERNAYVGSKLQSTLLEATSMITTIMMGTHCGDSETVTREWFAVCEEAMQSLFHIHPTPDKVAALVLQHMYANLSVASSGSGNSSSAEEEGDGSTQLQQQQQQQSVCALARLLFVLGQTSLCSLVYTEFLAACAKKYPVKDADTGKKTAADASKAGGNKKGDGTRETGAFKEDSGAVDAMEEEMGAAAAADADHERLLNQIIEQELVMKNILGKFLPLLSYMVANEQQKFSHPLLRETSILAMCRYMCTSSVVCESLLPLLFTVLERETAVSVRTTVMIALGDLAFRFPNSIEPWTHRMYSRLRDDNVTVRYNTLMVITHLVLNDMIKVKGQVSHVAHSLNDPNEAIAELAKLFFIKLSERSNNPVYNLLGDIISIFSQDVGVMEKDLAASAVGPAGAAAVMPILSKEQFQSTMHFLLSFVQKDKQADTLLERLLLRMSMSPSLLQRRNLAFCISELSVTEKGVKKMIELIKNIKDSLYDNEVYECFRTTLARAKKVVRGAAAAETKTAMEDFEQLMTRIHNAANGEQEVLDPEGGLLNMGDVAVALEALDQADGQQDSGGEEAAPGKSTRAKGKAKATKAPAKKAAAKPKAAAKKSTRGKRSGNSSDEGEGEQSESDLSDREDHSDVENRGQNKAKKGAATAAAATKKAPVPARTARRAAVIQSDDDDEEEED